MRKPWRKSFEPWREFPGWEFDLLRTLPTSMANRLYGQAWVRARGELPWGWRWWVLIGLISGFTWLSVALIWIAAALLGLGGLGRIGLEIVFHLTVGAILFRPLAALYHRWTLSAIRAALVDELLWFAEQLDPTEP